jgi:hypothetical protein
VNFFGGNFAEYAGNHFLINRRKSKETCEKISSSQKGKILSEEHRRRIGKKIKEKFECDPTLKERISASMKGKKHSAEHNERISKTRSERIQAGEIVISSDKISESVTKKYLEGGYEWAKGEYSSLKMGVVIHYRSSWELEFAKLLDTTDKVKEWKYEPFYIMYKLDGKQRRYLPDFIVKTDDEILMVEIKPLELSETKMNIAKRQAAIEYADKQGWKYIVWSLGQEIFS